MRSSTSSSDAVERAPDLSWIRMWLLAILLAITTIGSYEILLRANGHRPTILDSPELWTLHRRQVQPRQVVLLGASRMQIGFSVDAFRERYPDTPITMLAVAATPPGGALFELSNDDSFEGLVICSLPNADSLNLANWPAMAPYVDTARTAPFYSSLETRLACTVDASLASADSRLSLKSVAREILLERRLPKPRYINVRFDRCLDADFQLVDESELEYLRARYFGSPIPDGYAETREAARSGWLESVDAVADCVKRIRDRGGEVVFAFLPVDEALFEKKEQEYPRELYWDVFAERVGAPTIHFRDVPGMNVPTPEGSHVDVRDKGRMTTALIAKLEELGVIPLSPY